MACELQSNRTVGRVGRYADQDPSVTVSGALARFKHTRLRDYSENRPERRRRPRGQPVHGPAHTQPDPQLSRPARSEDLEVDVEDLGELGADESFELVQLLPQRLQQPLAHLPRQPRLQPLQRCRRRRAGRGGAVGADAGGAGGADGAEEGGLSAG